jgi:hypothetical protein
MQGIISLVLILIICIIIFYFLNKFLERNKLNKFINLENFQSWNNNNNEEYILPKDIYAYWDNPDEHINAYINTWRRNLSSEWNVHFITKKNIMEYVDNDFYNKFKNLPSFRFADFLRLYLLIKNGGVWFDTTSIIINGNFLDYYWNEMHENKYDVTLYELSDHSYENHPYLENWFFMAPKNSKFMIDLYNEFTRSFEMDFLVYKKKVLMPSINLKNTLKNGSKTYLMQHAIIHYLLKYNKYNMNIKDANESMFKIQHINDWNSDKLIDYIIQNDLKDCYAIKLVKFNRRAIKDIDKFIERLNNI